MVLWVNIIFQVVYLHEVFNNAVNIASDDRGRPALKSSLKAVGSKNAMCYVTWADQNRTALIEPAEAISLGTSEGDDAVSKEGIIISPDMVCQKQHGNDYDNGKNVGENEIFEIDRGVVKWPKKPVLLDTNMFDVDDSWYDMLP
ncbi:hypothetical protein GUJ93_ZPchr0012g19869 [Zizania palustris]|uniref:Uncharacterized protein n=1 Tax=Zizania palustris TaxID=103762 RepID=A0A8J6BNF4_ZIZPA|nr:hypothetical protein GUJ93_ZPchr0012g19869 [Zizania palustris]